MRRRDLIVGFIGAGTLWPNPARTQKAMRVVGYLNSTSPGAAAPFVSAFRQALTKDDYIDGKNLTIEYRWAEGNYDLLPVLAEELVARKVEVIVPSGGDRSSVAATGATSTIPIVSVIGGDPVAAGFVSSLAHPGGNLTGVSLITVQLMPKRLELLSELVPQAKEIALLVNPDNPQTESVIRDMQDAAQSKSMQLAHPIRDARDQGGVCRLRSPSPAASVSPRGWSMDGC